MPPLWRAEEAIERHDTRVQSLRLKKEDTGDINKWRRRIRVADRSTRRD